MKLNTFYVEGYKFYWLNLQRKVQIPCFPENKTGLILIFTPKYGTRAYFRGMYYFDISKNEALMRCMPSFLKRMAYTALKQFE